MGEGSGPGAKGPLAKESMFLKGLTYLFTKLSYILPLNVVVRDGKTFDYQILILMNAVKHNTKKR